MKHTLVRLGLTALVTSVLFGCGGGSDGAAGTNSVTTINQANKVSIPSNSTAPSSAAALAWRSLEPQITVTSVTIASPPVVKFAVTDAQGNAVVGLGNTSQGTSNTSSSVKALTNLRFTLAKLVPASGTAPSKWVSYLVVKPATVGQVNQTGTASQKDKSYCTADLAWCGTNPTTDNEGTLVDNGDGTYQYTFKRDITKMADIVASLGDSTDGLKKRADLGAVSYDSSLTHRLGIQVSGAAPGTGTNNPTASSTTGIDATNIAIPANAVYDFVPNGGAVASTRDIVELSSCNSCHNGKGLIHGGGRKDPKLCVTCHTDQVKYGNSTESISVANGYAVVFSVPTLGTTTGVIDGRAVGDFPNMMHKIHMGSELSLKKYNYAGATFDETEWIQDPRNCTKCHSGQDKTDASQATKTKDGDNWMNKPSRLACAACHDNVSFASTVPDGFVQHTGGAAGDDSTCASCHSASGQAGSVPVSHRAEYPTPNNLTQIEGIASFSYEIKSVVLNATRQPEITFRIMKSGVPDAGPVTAFNTPTLTSTNGIYSVPNNFELIPGFTQALDPSSGRTYGPTFYVSYAVPQDGIKAPADFNVSHSVSLASMLVVSGHPKAGMITPAAGADGTNGYLVATLTGSAGQAVGVNGCAQSSTAATDYCSSPTLIKIPAAAKMVTGAIIGNFAQTFTVGTKLAEKFPSGAIIKTPMVQKLATMTGNTARRVIVDNNKCEACHEQLGSAVSFHGGARNDATSCAICHNPNRTREGWSSNASTFVHAIHAGTSPTSAAAINAGTAGVNSKDDVGVPGKGLGGAGLTYRSGKRYIPFSWYRLGPATAPTWNAAAFVYPGILKRCDNCHVPNAVNFGANGSTLLPTLLWTTSGTGIYSATDNTKSYARDPMTGALKYIETATMKPNGYGNVFQFVPEGSVVGNYKNSSNLTVSTGFTDASGLAVTSAYRSFAGAQGVTLQADPQTLVESPVSASCFACHDSAGARGHMTQGPGNGVIYGRRGDFLPLTNGVRVDGKFVPENCLECHGMGRDQDAAVVHSK